MCGIFGIASFPLPENSAIKDALDSIRHRGPDDEGYLFVNTFKDRTALSFGADTCLEFKEGYKDILNVNVKDHHLVLAHRRLSILDLSSKGHQPMSYADGDLWITYNGEIFNYREIKAELRSQGFTFGSDTDTEVILAAYAAWGEKCVERFNGQWAFCIYDGKRKTLFCSRDRFGIKPFYYWYDGKNFAFSSEIKALEKLPFVKMELNKNLVADFIIFSMLDHTEETIFRNIKQLPPSHNLTFAFNNGDLRIRRYYDLPYTDEWGTYIHRRALQYADDIRDLLIDAVKIRLMSDVPVGSCLSGGLDSSSIVVIIDKLLREGNISGRAIGKKQRTFTAAFNDPRVDEKIFADEVSGCTSVVGSFVYPDAEKLWSEIDGFLSHQDGICFATNVYAGWDVMRLASRCVKVVLNGQGGDELFGGYIPRYEPVYIADILKGARLKKFLNHAVRKISLYGFGDWLRKTVMGVYLSAAPNRLQAFLYTRRNKMLFNCVEKQTGENPVGREGLERMCDRIRSFNYKLWKDAVNDYLPQLLHYDDRNASAFSIENRVPFVDHRLAEYAFAIPSVYKFHNGWSKFLLRLAMRDLLPEKILWRRDKIGFSTPEKSWMRYKNSPIPPFMDRIGVKKYDHFVWRLHVMERLLHRIGHNEVKAK